MSTEKNFYNFYYNDDLPVHLLTCGYVTWTEDYYYGPTTRYDYIIHYINQGVMHFTLNGKKYDAHTGEYCIIYPGETASYYLDPSNYGMNFIVTWIGLNCERSDLLMKYLGITENEHIVPCYSTDFTRAVLDIFAYVESVNPKKHSQLKLAAMGLTALDLLKKNDAPRQNKPDYVKSALNYINYKYIDGITVRDISDSLALNRSYFFKLFKQETGMSPEKYLIEFRISKAKELLLIPDITVDKVASAVGFFDPYYFSRVFKKSVGVSPKEYANKYKTEN